MEGGSRAPATCPFFNRAQSVKRDFSTMANSTRSTSPDSLFVSEDDHYGNEQPAQRPQPSRLALPGRAARFPGDGLDFRRPVMSAESNSNTRSSRAPAPQMVIDLTEEDEASGTDPQTTSEPTVTGTAGSSRAQRLPRYGRNIIDISDGDADDERTEARSSRPNFADFLPPPGHRNHRDHHPRIALLRRPQRHASESGNTADTSNMDDLEILETRPRSRPQTASRSNTPAVPAQRSVTPYPTGLSNTIDLTTEDDDDVVVTDARPRGGVNLTSPGTTGGVGTRSAAERPFEFAATMLHNGSRLLQRMGNLAGFDPRPQQQGMHEREIHHHHRGGVHIHRAQNNDHAHLRFAEMPPRPALGMAIDMDYAMTGFDLGIIGGNRTPTPKYEPPEPAAEGFTRTPGEDEVVVCPNCGDELAVGDSEKKQAIWVIKKCGHVYCGDCAENRTKASKKGKGKAPANAPLPFKSCVVNGCKESASSKSMVRVFFGS